MKKITLISVALWGVACSSPAQEEAASQACRVERVTGGVEMTCPGAKTYMFKDATSGKDATGFALLVETTDVPAGDGCAQGGVEVRVGRDDNGDGAISDNEQTDRQVICSGEGGEDAVESLTTSTVIEPGEVCGAGGTLVRVGVDADADGALSASEASFETALCAPNVNACSRDHLVVEGACQPWYAVELEGVVVSATRTPGVDRLPVVMAGDAVSGVVVYPWEREDWSYRVDSGFGSPRIGRWNVYTFEPGEVRTHWTLGGLTFSGVGGGFMELGGYQPRDPGTVWELGSHVAVRDLRDDQGAPASPQALDWSVTLPETVERLGSYRPSTPEFWSQNVPFSLTLSDVQGEVVVEVRAVTRLDAIP